MPTVGHALRQQMEPHRAMHAARTHAVVSGTRGWLEHCDAVGRSIAEVSAELERFVWNAMVRDVLHELLRRLDATYRPFLAAVDVAFMRRAFGCDDETVRPLTYGHASVTVVVPTKSPSESADDYIHAHGAKFVNDAVGGAVAAVLADLLDPDVLATQFWLGAMIAITSLKFQIGASSDGVAA